MVVPRFVRQALQGEPLTVYGDGKQSRCFLHVGDAVEALIALMDCPDAVGEVFNIGSLEEVTILDLAQRVVQAVDGGNSRIMFVPYEEAYAAGFEDMYRRVPDVSKVRGYTGWTPTKSLDEIIMSVVSAMSAEN